MNKKFPIFISSIVISLLLFLTAGAIGLNSINSTYNSGDTLEIPWFNDLKSKIKNIYGNDNGIGIKTLPDPNYSLKVSGNIWGSGLCLKNECKSEWASDSPWAISGSNIFYTGGNVGIGTTDKITSTLTVSGSIGNSKGDFNFNGEGIMDSDSVRVFSTGGNLYLQNGGGNNIFFRNKNNGVHSVFTDDGSLGIGTSTPTTKLDIRGYVRFDQGASYDVWLQGGDSTAWGNARNLALLGIKSTDQLHLNYNNEYAGGTIIGGAVGIGINPPTQTLDVGGIIKSNAGFMVGNGNPFIYPAGDDLRVRSGPASAFKYFTFSGNGNFYVHNGGLQIGGNLSVGGNMGKVCVTRSSIDGTPWSSCPGSHPYWIIGWNGGTWASPEYNTWHTSGYIWICCK